MTKARAPHQAVVLIKVEVHELNENGSCSAKLVDAKTLDKFGLKSKQVLSVKGENRTTCLKKLKGILDEFDE